MVQTRKRTRAGLLLCPPLPIDPRWRMHFVNSFLPFDGICAAVQPDLNLFDHHLPILFEPIFPTSRPTIDRFSSFLLFRCSFPPFSYTFDLLVKTIIEQASSFRRDISYPRILYHFPRHTFHCSNILRVLSTREVDTSLDLIVEQLVSANLSTISTPSIETWKNAIVFPLSNSLSFSFYFLFISLNSPKFLKECKYRRSSVIISIGYLIENNDMDLYVKYFTIFRSSLFFQILRSIRSLFPRSSKRESIARDFITGVMF